MEKKFVIQNAKDKKYWCGYIDKNWSDNISDAKLFSTKEKIEEWILYNADKIKGKFLFVIEVWL